MTPTPYLRFVSRAERRPDPFATAQLNTPLVREVRVLQQFWRCEGDPAVLDDPRTTIMAGEWRDVPLEPGLEERL